MAKYGWTPVVLNRNDAVLHPNFNKWSKSFEKLPTVNNKQYEVACYRRWIAMAAIGGGFMCDFDVINYGLEPFAQDDGLICYQGWVPSFVSGSVSDFEFFAELFSRYRPKESDTFDGRPHVSDQIVMFNCKLFKEQMLVKNYGEHGYESSKLIHYANSCFPFRPRHISIYSTLGG